MYYSKNRVVALAALILASSGAAWGLRAATPRRVPAPSREAAAALLVQMDAASHSPTAAPSTPLVRTQLRSEDHVHGIETWVGEASLDYVIVCRPFQSAPEYAAHLTQPTLPAAGRVEIEQFGVATRYDMAAIGSSLVAIVPKSDLLPLTPTVFRAGVWGAGADESDPEAALSWFDVEALSP